MFHAIPISRLSVLILIFGFFTSVLAQNSSTPKRSAFREIPIVAIPASYLSERTVTRARNVGMNRALFDSEAARQLSTRKVADPGSLMSVEMSFFPDVSLTVSWSSVTQSDDKVNFIWTGKIEGNPFGSAVLIASGDLVTANINPGDGLVYQIRTLNDKTWIREIDQTRFRDEKLPIEIPNGSVDHAVIPASTAITQTAVTQDDGYTIDVMVVFTPAARAEAGGTAAMQQLVEMGIRLTNDGYQNSGVVHRVRLVYSGEIAYTETGNVDTDLDRLASDNDGFLDSVHTLRNTYGADLVSLWIKEHPLYCGVAFLLSNPSNPSLSNAFSVVDHTCATTQFSFGHELGHNMGSSHAREDGTGPGAFAYSYGFKNYSGHKFRTIMAYQGTCNCSRANLWSNPGVSWYFPTGKDVDSPLSAANYLTLNKTRNVVSNYRASAVPVGVGSPATMITPVEVPYSHLSGSTVTFTWNPGVGGTQYRLRVGSSAGGTDLFDQNTGLGTSQVVTGLPTNGSSFHVYLYTLLSGTWQIHDYVYWAYNLTNSFPESAHPYSNNTDKTWTYIVPGNPTSLSVTFDSQTSYESSYDYIHITDSNGKAIAGSPFTSSSSLANATVVVPGSSVTIQLFSDTSNTGYGFKVTNIVGTSTPPKLSIVKTHNGSFIQGQNNALYMATVSNDAAAGSTSGVVTVTETLPSGLTLASMTGSGWTCTSNSCTRSDVLTAGSSYPVVVVGVNVALNAVSSVTNQVTVSGGGAATATASDVTTISPAPVQAPSLTAPANGATNVSSVPSLTWIAVTGATSYDVYFGTAASPPMVVNTTSTTYTPSLLNPSTTYSWKITAKNSVGSAPSTIWSFTTSVAGTPSVAAISPVASIGAAQQYTFQFSHSSGNQSLGVANVLINNFLDGRQACYLAYSVPTNTLYIVPDSGDAAQLSGKVMNGSGSLGNSQCSVNLASSTATGSGNLLTLNLAMTFLSSFAGNKVVYLAARDNGTGNTGWQTMGTHGVPPIASTFPNPIGITPSSGSAASQLFSLTLQDQFAASNLQTAWMLINTAIDGRAACYVAYYRPGNQIYLYPDNGDGAQATSMILTGTNSLNNSQCTISAQGSSVVLNGSQLVVTFTVTFKPAFTGNKGVWMAVQTIGGAQTSPWQAVGARLVP